MQQVHSGQQVDLAMLQASLSRGVAAAFAFGAYVSMQGLQQHSDLLKQRLNAEHQAWLWSASSIETEARLSLMSERLTCLSPAAAMS